MRLTTRTCDFRLETDDLQKRAFAQGSRRRRGLCDGSRPPRFRQLVRLAGFHAAAGQPSLRQLEQHDRLRLGDLEEHRRVHVDADEDDARVVGRPVAGIPFLAQ